MPFWRRGKRTAGAAPTAPSRPSKRARVQFAPDTASPGTTADTATTKDSNKTTHSSTGNPPPSARWNPAISPSSPEFAAVVDEFSRLLRSPAHTVDSILRLKFTPLERALLAGLPSSPEAHAHSHAHADATTSVRAGSTTPLLPPKPLSSSSLLRSMQRENARRYGELLGTARFADWKGRADLPFKLAVAWFGLPVAPLGPGVVGRDGSDGGEGGVEGEGDAEGGSGEELRFLNSYRERWFGGDGVREPDPRWEAYYAKQPQQHSCAPGTLSGTESLGLRGGAAPPKLEEESRVCEGEADAGEAGSLTASQLMLRGSGVDETSSASFGEVVLRGGARRGAGGHSRARVTGRVSGGAGDGVIASNVFKELHDFAETEEAADRWLSKRGWADSLQTSLGGTSSDVEARWYPLYGYQGVVWFQADLLYTFVDAVDRLLGLDNRAGVSYNLYCLDKDRTGRDTAFDGLTIWCSGVGDYSHDQLAWEWVLDKIEGLGDAAEQFPHVFFVASPGDPVPGAWEPDASHRVLKVVLDYADASLRPMHRPDVAYIRMPENPRDVTYTNQFGPWMASACRVLAAGRIPGRPGYPAIPDAWISAKGLPKERDAKGTYGGLVFLPQVWDAVVAQWEKDKAAPLTLKAWTGTQYEEDGKLHLTDRWHIFVPGLDSQYEQQYILHDEVDDARAVLDKLLALMQESLPTESFLRMQSIELHFPGAGFFIATDDPPELVVPMAHHSADDLESHFQRVVDLLFHWKKWLQEKPEVPPLADGLNLFPQFITLRPVFAEYFICDADQRRRPIQWDPTKASLADFRKLVAELWSGNDGRRQNVADCWVGITQGRSTLKGRTPKREANKFESKPRLLVGPGTTEEEWDVMRRMIVEPHVYVVRVSEKTLPRFGDTDANAKGLEGKGGVQPFGYRDIYQTPESLLYSALETDKLPVSSRHYDWQLWGEDVTEQLKTVQPWEEQPESLSALYEPEDFPLKLRPSAQWLPGDREAGEAPRSQAEYYAKPGRVVEDTTKPSSTRRTAPDDGGWRTVTDVETGQRLREHSYSHPLDVYPGMSMPINAPPVSSVLNLRLDSMPAVSLSVLTPTETRRLQRDYYDMRNLLLSRTERCPYPGCGAVFPANRRSAMEQHLRDKHVAEKCNFCNDPLFRHWSPEQVYEHTVSKHSGVFRTMEARLADTEVEIPDEGRTDRRREGIWNFCTRCGRDHRLLAAPADRSHHGNVCYPGEPGAEQGWSACGTCGERIPQGAASRGLGHVHGRNADDDGKPFCERCALPLGFFSDNYRKKHTHFCAGHGRDNTRYCPWCGIELDQALVQRSKHIEHCLQKPGHAIMDPASWRYFFLTEENPGVPRPDGGQQKASKKTTAKKPRTTPAPVIATSQGQSRHEPRPRSGSFGTAVSSPPSSTHSSRSTQSWRPPLPPPPPPTPPTAPVKPAAKAAGPATTGAEDKPAAPARGKKPTKPVAKPRQPKSTKKTKQPSPASAPAQAPARAPAPEPTPVPTARRVTRSMTRGSTKRKRPADEGGDDDDDNDAGAGARPAKAAKAAKTTSMPTETPGGGKGEKGGRGAEGGKVPTHTAKAARTVSYAEPLVRGASPARGVAGRKGVDVGLVGVLRKSSW